MYLEKDKIAYVLKGRWHKKSHAVSENDEGNGKYKYIVVNNVKVTAGTFGTLTGDRMPVENEAHKVHWCQEMYGVGDSE